MGQIERRKRVIRIEAVWHLADAVSIAGGFLLGYAVRFSPLVLRWFPAPSEVPSISLYLRAGLVAAVVWIVLFHLLGLYRAEGTRRGLRTPVLLRATGLGMLLNAGVAFFYREASFSRLAAPIIWLATFLLLRTLRRASLALLVRAGAVPPIRFALVGPSEAGLKLALGLPRAGVVPHRLCGLFRESDDPPAPEGIADLGAPAEIEEQAQRLSLDRILFALPASRQADLERWIAACRRLDLEVDVVPEMAFPFGGGIQVEEVAGLPVVRPRRLPLAGWNGVVKRTFDLVISGLLLVLVSPALAACAIAVRLDSPGPVLYGQERMGRDRRVFRMLKFRSMRSDAEAGSGPVWASAEDPRRTRVGRFLRTWSLDELPQLWNVFRGDMSLVGPRPERPHFVERFYAEVPLYHGRHRIKSGLTGWAQVNGLRGNVPIEERTAYDLYYIENWSLWFDVRILLMTARAVVTHRGS
ncbi:MAG: sugar transferase [Candidatus Eisenbacteria bacterium]